MMKMSAWRVDYGRGFRDLIFCDFGGCCKIVRPGSSGGPHDRTWTKKKAAGRTIGRKGGKRGLERMATFLSRNQGQIFDQGPPPRPMPFLGRGSAGRWLRIHSRPWRFPCQGGEKGKKTGESQEGKKRKKKEN